MVSIKIGGARGQINGSSLKTLHLPPLGKLESQCKSLLEECDRLTRLGEKSYPEAEAELLDRLGWEELRKQRTELSYVRNFSEIKDASRSDAEFFQPQCDRLARRLAKRGAQTIDTFCPRPTRGVQPQIIEGGDVVVVDSKSVRPQGVEPAAGESTNNDFRALPCNAKARVRRGDVLLNSTGRGTLGRRVLSTRYARALRQANCLTHVSPRPDSRSDVSGRGSCS